MPPSSRSFMLGLLSGSAQGVLTEQLAARQLELDNERQKLATANALLQKGDFETFLLLDPKIRKSIGVTPEVESGLAKLVGQQKEDRTLRMRGLLASTRASEAQANVADVQAQTAQQRQQAIAGLPEDELTDVLVPERQQRKTLAAQQKTAELQAQSVELDIKQKQRADAAYETLSASEKKFVDSPILARMEESRMQRETQLATAKISAGAHITAAKIQAETSRAVEQMRMEKQAEINDVNLKKADRVEATQLGNQQIKLETELGDLQQQVKVVKAGKLTYGQFETEAEAKAFEEKVNRVISQHNNISARRAALLGEEFTPVRPWAVHPVEASGGLFGLGAVFGKDTFLVGPPATDPGEAGTASAPVSPLQEMFNKQLESLKTSQGTPSVPSQMPKPAAEPTASTEPTLAELQSQFTSPYYRNRINHLRERWRATKGREIAGATAKQEAEDEYIRQYLLRQK